MTASTSPARKNLRRLSVVCAGFFSSSVIILVAWLGFTPANENPAAIPDACRADMAEIDRDFATSKPVTDCDIRQRYLAATAQLASKNNEWQQRMLPLALRAQCAFAWRHHARLVARDAMDNHWEIGILRLRDLVKYGDADGPVFSTLLSRQHAQGKDHDTAYNNIIQSARQTDSDVNQSCPH
ncbi:MAG TPA: hypothetical protein PLF22_01455 [Pseudomonadales bacterium]|nr:hypothetical protein [Pseudomonadales bacterium]